MRTSSTRPTAKRLATDVASGDLDHAVTRKLLRLGHGCLDAVDEVKRRLGVSPRAPAGVATDTWSIPLGGFPSQPSVMYVEDVAAGLMSCPDLVPVRPGVIVGHLRHLQLAALVQQDVTAGQPIEQRSGLIILVDEAVLDTELYMTTLPTGLSSAQGAPPN